MRDVAAVPRELEDLLRTVTQRKQGAQWLIRAFGSFTPHDELELRVAWGMLKVFGAIDGSQPAGVCRDDCAFAVKNLVEVANVFGMQSWLERDDVHPLLVGEPQLADAYVRGQSQAAEWEEFMRGQSKAGDLDEVDR